MMSTDYYNRLTWLEQELARWTYKPGFTFELMSPERRSAAPFEPDWYGDMPSLRITARLPDSRRETAADPPVMEIGPDGEVRIRRQRQLIPISQAVAVPPYVETSEDFARWFASVLLDFERHEQREWLHRDGAIFDDPHASGARR